MSAIRHCDGVFQGSPVQDFIPSDNGLAVLAEKVSYPLDEEGLELLLVF